MRPCKPLVPMTAEQRSAVEDMMPYVTKMAHNFWRWAHVPARYLEDLRSDAYLFACIAASKYKAGCGYSIEVKIIMEVKSRLTTVAKKYRSYITAADDEDGHMILSNVPSKDYEDSDIDDLLAEIKQLPEISRIAIERRYGLDGLPAMSIQETAKSLGRSFSSIDNATRRAKRILQQRFAKGA